MADKNIGALPSAASLDDDSLLVAEQQGQAVSVSGSLFKNFARASVSQYVDSAKGYADAAKKSADDAAGSLSRIGDSVTQAAASAASASESAASAQTAQGAAEAAQTAAEQAKADAESAKADVDASKTAAEAAKTAAESAAVQTGQDKTAAEAAKSAAQTAQAAAETAKTAAETASTTAAQKAEQAAASAETAQQYSGKPPIVQNGNWWTWNAAEQKYTDTGKRAVLGFDKVYSSVTEMEADKDNQPDTTVAIISSSVDDEDNAKLYIKNGENWEYLADLSGFTGVGVQSIQLTSGNHAPGTTDVYTITLTDGSTTQITVYNGRDGEGSGDVIGISFSVTLLANSWVDGIQNINDSRFRSDAWISYLVGPASTNYQDYVESVIHADDVTTEGVMTFHSEADPGVDLSVNILRLEVPNG